MGAALAGCCTILRHDRGGRNKPFPNAHRYRDYVINSFNKDKPFDQFIMEQIAGDLMPSSSDKEYNEKLTGTGFLALGPHNYELQDKELLRMEVVDEQLSAWKSIYGVNNRLCPMP